MGETDRVTIEDTIEQIARGLARAGVVGASDDDLTIESIDLTLKLVTGKGIGGKTQLTVFGFTIGGEAKYAVENSTELVVKLTAADIEAKLLEDDDNRPVAYDIADAIESIRASAKAAAQHLPLVPFKESTVTLSFTVTAKGSISVIGTGEISSARAHTLKLKFAPR